MSGSESVQVFVRLFHVLTFEVQLSGRDRIPLTCYIPPHLCACLTTESGFPMSYDEVFLCVQWIKRRGDCSFCWYLWKCWPSLFRLSFINIDTHCHFYQVYFVIGSTHVWNGSDHHVYAYTKANTLQICCDNGHF